MSFSITKVIKELKTYPEFGTSDKTSDVERVIEFSAKQIVSFDSSGNAQALFDVKIEGVETPGTYYYPFSYSGNGNPLEEAEQLLKASFEE
ncbi:hypothetical protein GHCGIGKI_00100 [Klebsiella phage P01]|nr:hypothetical protein GHCGIGKI_00100 [Klebsiella phage P01]